MQQTIGHCFIVRVSGRYVDHQQGTQKNPIFSCFSKFYPPLGSKIQIRPRNDSTQCGTRFFDVESARVAALEVPDPMRDRVTDKKRYTISLTQNGAGGRTAVKLPQHLRKWSQFF